MKNFLFLSIFFAIPLCLRAASLFDDATVVVPKTGNAEATVSRQASLPASSGVGAADSNAVEQSAPMPIAQTSVQYSVGKPMPMGNRALTARNATMPDGRLVRVYTPVETAPAASEQASNTSGETPARPPESAAIAQEADNTPQGNADYPIEDFPPPAAARAAFMQGQAALPASPQDATAPVVSPPLPTAPKSALQPQATIADYPLIIGPDANAAMPQPTAPAIGPVAFSTPPKAHPATGDDAANPSVGHASILMPGGRTLRVESHPSVDDMGQNASMSWTLDLPGEGPIRVTPDMLNDGKVTLPDGRIITLPSGADIAAQQARERASHSLFENAEPVESRLAAGGENRKIPVRYMIEDKEATVPTRVEHILPTPSTQR